ncbi:WhiB family transcriptional regulator [Streptomyces sp. NRRL F-5123]|uniref:WhiB family transcriptional regulator n=1 Tax=Streptomyces sp. NRRL F-5123 TaxID=1463856 RepID=UPI0006935D71|nr:histone-like nucleoid-structuring protein Lsr2 [Streptomyces sp. NRRL F-5123]
MTAPRTAHERWWEHAACKGQPLEAWFPPAGANALPSYARARRTCAACPVLAACLDEDIQTSSLHHRFGMRAGLLPEERDAIARGDITADQALDQALADLEPQETTVTVTDITPTPPPAEQIPTTTEALIEWGAAHTSSRVQSLAGKARSALADLRQAAEREARVTDAEARIKRLKAQLANAERDLAAAKSTKPKPGSTTTLPAGTTADYPAIRAWARENGIRVPERGIPKREIRDAYYAAHNAA